MKNTKFLLSFLFIITLNESVADEFDLETPTAQPSLDPLPSETPMDSGVTNTIGEPPIENFISNTPVADEPVLSTVATTPDRIYSHKNQPSNFEFNFKYSPSAFGRRDITDYQQNVNSQAVFLDLSYKFNRNLSIGPTFGLYPTRGLVEEGNVLAAYPNSKNTQVTKSTLSLYHYGLNIKLDLDFIDQQPVVPFFTYNFLRFHYAFNNDVSGNLAMKAYSVGLKIPLNQFDEDSAHNLVNDFGINLTSLTIEALNTTGSSSDDVISMSGFSYYGGLRFEW